MCIITTPIIIAYTNMGSSASKENEQPADIITQFKNIRDGLYIDLAKLKTDIKDELTPSTLAISPCFLAVIYTNCVDFYLPDGKTHAYGDPARV